MEFLIKLGIRTFLFFAFVASIILISSIMGGFFDIASLNGMPITIGSLIEVTAYACVFMFFNIIMGLLFLSLCLILETRLINAYKKKKGVK